MNSAPQSQPSLVHAHPEPSRSPRWCAPSPAGRSSALSVNDVVGSGVLPASRRRRRDCSAPRAPGPIVAAGLAVGLLVLCFAEAGELLRRARRRDLYTRDAFGDFIGFEVGWMTWIARIASVA